MDEEKQIQPAQQPNLQHGVFPFIRSGLHPCNKCVKRKICPKFEKDGDCFYLGEFQKAIETSVMDLNYVDEQDRPLAQMLAKEMGILALCEMYFAEEGMIIHNKRSKTLENQPLLVMYNSFVRSAKQSMVALGLGPTARVRLDMDKANTTKKIAEVGQVPERRDEGTDFLDD